MRTSRVKIVVFSVLLLAVAFVVAEVLTGKIDIFHKNASPTANQYTKGESDHQTNNQGSTPPTTDNNPSTGSTKTDGTNSGATALIAPTGDFVSNHHPNLSGQPAPNEITSVCTTTPGAMCQIVFTNGTTTKQLPSEKADAGGTAYWDWKLQDIGLTTGTWKIKVLASLNGQTKTSYDATDLEVSP